MSNSFVTPGTVAHKSVLSVGFPRQEHWSGLPFPSPGDFPDPEIKPTSPAPLNPCILQIFRKLKYFTAANFVSSLTN